MSTIPSAMHVGLDEIPWVTNPRVHAKMRLLQVDPAAGMSVSHGLMPAGLAVGTHRHRGPVQMWTMSGSWVYREHDYAVFPMTIHQDVAGRPQVLMMLERLFRHMSAHPGVRFVTMDEMADDFAKRFPPGKAKARSKTRKG